VRLPSGVVYREITPGSGTSPRSSDTVTVHYRGTLIDGTEFDSSRRHGEAPASFPLNGVVPCWTQGIVLMRPGGHARLVCPPDTAYGETARPNIPANSTLVFDVELLRVSSSAGHD
jgi:FKBP-type peptidyl-prolyl cis-trans isomerase FkpA